jgi:hypothetical protein
VQKQSRGLNIKILHCDATENTGVAEWHLSHVFVGKFDGIECTADRCRSKACRSLSSLRERSNTQGTIGTIWSSFARWGDSQRGSGAAQLTLRVDLARFLRRSAARPGKFRYKVGGVWRIFA